MGQIETSKLVKNQYNYMNHVTFKQLVIPKRFNKSSVARKRSRIAFKSKNFHTYYFKTETEACCIDKNREQSVVSG